MRTHSAMFQPYWYITPSVHTIVYGLLIALAPQVLLLCVAKNTAAILVVAAAIAASVTADIVAVIVFNTGKSRFLIACVQGCMAGMFFPQNYPVFSVYIITFCSFMLVKYFPGSLAGSWINAAAFAVAAAYFVGANFFPAQQPAVPAQALAITQALNSTVFRFTGASVPGSYISLLWDSGSAIPAFRFNTLILAASLFLISFNMINWIIPACFLGAYLLFVWLFGGLAAGASLASGDVLLAALTGGTLFTAFFLLDWFGTSPLSRKGKIIYGVCAGITAFFISGCGMSPSGAAFTVLASNLISTVIQFFETKQSRRNVLKKIIPQINDVWRLSND